MQDWQGKLVCDDFSGYKASFGGGIVEIGCMAHARRKYFELHDKHKSELAGQALRFIAGLYEIEREVRDAEPELRLEASSGIVIMWRKSLTSRSRAFSISRKSREENTSAEWWLSR